MKRPAAQIGVALTRVRIEAAVLRRRVRNRMQQQWEFRWFWWLQLGVYSLMAYEHFTRTWTTTLYPDLDCRERRERERDFLLRALIES